MPNRLKLHVFFHLYKGNNGERIAEEYIKLLNDLCAGYEIEIRFHIYCYGYHDKEINIVKEVIANSVNNIHNIGYKFNKKSESEVPTLIETQKKVEKLKDTELVCYMHARGSSYRIEAQEKFKLLAKISITSIAAILISILEHKDLLEKYKVAGAFPSVGVFEKYGKYSLALAGNFWITTAGHIKQNKIDEKWYINKWHARHLAEEYIARTCKPSEVFGVYSSGRFELDSKKSNYYEKVKLIVDEINKVHNLDESMQIKIEKYISHKVKKIISRQIRYSEKRFVWKFRKLIFGRTSYIHHIKKIDRVMNKLFNYHNTELYKAEELETQYEAWCKIRKYE